MVQNPAASFLDTFTIFFDSQIVSLEDYHQLRWRTEEKMGTFCKASSKVLKSYPTLSTLFKNSFHPDFILSEKGFSLLSSLYKKQGIPFEKISPYSSIDTQKAIDQFLMLTIQKETQIRGFFW